MAQLICKNVSLGYDAKVIQKDINFSVDQGDYLCIVGENGAGKSTLIKTMLGLMKPLCGNISTGDGLLPTEIGYLPQQTVIQRDFPASVWEVILSGCQAHCGLRPFYNKQEKAIAKANIEKMGLTELEKAYEADKQRRLDRTVTLLKEIADEEMDGAEKEEFLKALGETDEKKP